MSLTNREFWTLIHGMVLGALFLLAFGGGLAGFYSLRPDLTTEKGIDERLTRLKSGTALMAVVAWLTVITGTYIVYPWYRARPPDGTTDLTEFPRSFLLENPNLAAWHTFGMEWKEHIAWIAPIMATVVAFLVFRYGRSLAFNSRLRTIAIVLFFVAFITAAVAGLFGALITKAAPIL